MRITNGIIRNNSLNSLYTNMSKLDRLYTQMNTMKKASKPSDDPVVVGRSMKLKIDIMESEQYKTNIGEASAWMDVTETSLSNMTEILTDIRTRFNQGANGSLKKEDMQKVVDDVVQLMEQLKQEANVSYGDRHVFSGYKTDKPVYLDKNTTLKEDVSLDGDITLSSDTDLSGAVLSHDVTLQDGTVIAAGTALPAGSIVESGTVIKTGSTLKAGTELKKGTLNPEVIGKTDNNNINYEIGISTDMTINTTGIPEIISKMEGVVNKLKVAINGDPKANPPVLPLEDDDLNQMFSELIGDTDELLSGISEKTAELGSKQKRLEYTDERLIDTKTN